MVYRCRIWKTLRNYTFYFDWPNIWAEIHKINVFSFNLSTLSVIFIYHSPQSYKVFCIYLAFIENFTLSLQSLWIRKNTKSSSAWPRTSNRSNTCRQRALSWACCWKICSIPPHTRRSPSTAIGRSPIWTNCAGGRPPSAPTCSKRCWRRRKSDSDVHTMKTASWPSTSTCCSMTTTAITCATGSEAMLKT